MGKSALDLGGHEVSKSNVYAVNPFAIDFAIEENHSREGDPHEIDDSIKELALTMLPVSEGGRTQLQPIKVFKDSSGRLRAFMGFRRLLAARWLVESGKLPDFKIKYEVVDSLSPEQREDANFIENYHRKDLSDVQKARMILRYHEVHGLKYKDIAARLGITGARVSQLKNLLTVPEPIQAAVDSGAISTQAALEIASSPQEVQQAIVEQIKSEPATKVTGQSVKDKKSDHHEKTGEGEPVKKKLNQVRALFEGFRDDNVGDPRGVVLATEILQWMDGELGDKAIQNRWDKAFPDTI
jgi:ParB/RepB/Spo0J family partition protein